MCGFDEEDRLLVDMTIIRALNAYIPFFLKLTDESRLLAGGCYMKTRLKLQTSGNAEKIHNIPTTRV